MKVRYLITKNLVTADEVQQYCRDNLSGLGTAKRLLENRTEPVLQYLEENGDFGIWRTVPTVTEYRKSSEDK